MQKVRKGAGRAGLTEPVRFLPETGLIDLMRQVERPGLVNFGAGVPSPALLPVEALGRRMAEAQRHFGPAMWAYQRPEGHEQLRDAIASRLRARGVEGVRGADFIATNGCTQALHLALSVLAGRGDIVACESPGYYNMLEQIHHVGARALPIPVDLDRGLDLEVAEKAFRRHRVRCLVVCTSLSNPTGATLSIPSRRRLVELCRKHGVVLLEDDIYAELCDGGAPPPARKWDDGSGVVYVTSFCKSVSPGLRVGCILAGPWFERVVRLKCVNDLHSPPVAEAALERFITSPDYDKHLARLRKTCARRREKVRKAVLSSFPEGTTVSRPEGGFLVWAQSPVRVDMKRLRERAWEAGVSFAPGYMFLTRKPETLCMRLNCARAEESELASGIRRLGALIG